MSDNPLKVLLVAGFEADRKDSATSAQLYRDALGLPLEARVG